MHIKELHVKNFFASMISIFSVVLATICFFIKLPNSLSMHKNKLKSILIGRAISNEVGISKKEMYADPSIPQLENPLFSKSSENNNELLDTPIPGKPTHKIIETQIREAGSKYENFYVKSDAPIELNIEKELKANPDIHIKKDGSIQVLIYHTHTTEAYMDKNNGFYYDDWCPRTMNMNKNVTQVGEQIANKLRNSGIGVVHDMTVHDHPSYNGAYKRSAQTIQQNLEKYPSIQVTIDLHRDGLGSDESGKIKPTFTYKGKKGAQIMIIAGCDPDGTLEFPGWEYNLRLALRLQQKTETLFPGMTRPMYFSQVRYNMNFTHGSLLIEVGSDSNTISEAQHSGAYLGESLASVLNDLIN